MNMIELNDAQIQSIAEKLAQAGIKRRDLREELLDHLCCLVETEMAQGYSFYQAMNLAFDTFQKDEMQDIQAQIISIHSKKRLLMRVSLLVLAVLMVFSGFLWNREAGEPPLEVAEMVSTSAFSFKPPSISPLGGTYSITSGFGIRMHPIDRTKHLHRGTDFKAPSGTPVLATSDGTVETAVFEKNYGEHIIIRHDSTYQTLYAHLSVIYVRENQQVSRGDTIGLVGSTGKSKAPHLHYEVLADGRPEDPEKYFGESDR